MTLPASKCSRATQIVEPLEAVSEEYDLKAAYDA